LDILRFPRGDLRSPALLLVSGGVIMVLLNFCGADFHSSYIFSAVGSTFSLF
jgi:hypothetical protein